MARIFCLLIVLACGQVSALHAQQVTLLFAGDAMQHQKQIDNAYRNGSYDYSSYFQHLAPAISQADLAIVNLEVTLGGKPYKGYPMFSAPDEYAAALKEAGFDVFLNANNHILDRFSRGLHRTLDVLDSLQVQHTGVFRNAEERAETYPLILEKNGIRMAFLNYTYATNGIKPQYPDVVNYINNWQIQQDIQKAKCQKADVIIANMHWGIEYKLIQNKEQENIAKFLIAEGVDIVMGSHPHVIQPSILTDSCLIVYSLGNFISGMTAVNTDGGQLIKVVLEKQKEKTIISSCGYILVYTVGANHHSPNHSPNHSSNSKVDYSVVPVLSAELDEINQRKMTRFADNARAIFNKYNQGVAEDSLSTVPAPNNEFTLKFFPLKFAE